jgi:tripartite-type tricarboxylate transporter receptor subunit TctC
MSVKRRTFIAAAAPALWLDPALGREKDLRIFVGFESGGGADAVARTIAAQLQRRISRHVVVENRTGQFGALPGEIIKKGAPDAADLALLSSTTLVSRLGSRAFPFDPISDLAPLTKVGNFSIAFAVAPQLEPDSFNNYLDWIRKGDPQRRRIAVSSNITFVEVLNVLLSRSIGTQLEPVQYRGSADILADMRDGRIFATVNTTTSLLPPHRGRRCRILMTTGSRRLAAAPDVPTASELGYSSLDMEEWFAFFAPPTTPAPVLAQLNGQLRTTIEDQEVIDSLRPLGLEVETDEPGQLVKLIEAHRRGWQARMTATGVPVLN